MLEMKLSSVVYQVVRAELKGNVKKGPPHPAVMGNALYFNFDVSLAHHVNNHVVGIKEYRRRKGLHLLYHSPRGSYVNVFSSVTENSFAKVGEVTNWKHETSHDTCWADIGTFSELYFSMSREINAEMVADGLPEVAPIEMHQFNSFRLFTEGLFQWIPVEVKNVVGEDYRKTVTIL